MLVMLQSHSFVVGLAKLTVLVVACALSTTPELCAAQRYHWPTLGEVLHLLRRSHDGADLAGRDAALEQVLDDESAEVAAAKAFSA